MEQNVLLDYPSYEEIEDEIIFTFNGESTKNHSIDLDAYATSLQGFYESFIKSNKHLINTSVSVEILGEHEGSLKAKIKYCAKIGASGIAAYAAIASILSFHGVNFDDVKNYSYDTYLSVINTLKYHHGKIIEIEKAINDIAIDEKDKEKFITLLKNNDFKKSLDSLTFCFDKCQLDEIKISQNEKSVSIFAYERPYFKAQLEDSEIIQEYDDILEVILIGRSDLWRFVGEKLTKEFNATINDTKFLEQIRLHPINKIFSMRFAAKVAKTIITKATKTKPDSPVYSIYDVKIMPEQGKLLVTEEKN